MGDENTQIILAGDVYIERLDENFLGLGMNGPLNTDAMVINQAVEEKKQLSRMRDTFGQTRASINLPTEATISIAFLDQPADVLAMMMLGDTVGLNEGAGSVTDEPITAVLGKWLPLSKRNLTAASVVVTDTVPSAAFTEGVDYEINYRLGLIRALGGSITEAMDLLVDLDHTAVSGTTTSGGTRSQISARTVLDGKNMVTGKSVYFESWRSTLRPDGELDLNSGEFITTKLTGTMVTPAGKNSPFKLDQLD